MVTHPTNDRQPPRRVEGAPGSNALVVLKGVRSDGPTEADEIDFDDLKSWLRRPQQFFRQMFRHETVTLRVPRTDAVARPFVTASLIRLLARRSARIVDIDGRSMAVSATGLGRLLWRFVIDGIGVPFLLRQVDRDVALLSATDPRAGSSTLARRRGRPVYLRSDLWYGIDSGGSVGHIAGVVNNLASAGAGSPILISSDRIPTVDPAIEVRLVGPSYRFWDFRELPEFAFTRRFLEAAEEAIAGRPIGLVYQRYSLNNYAGLALARRNGVPLVLEYNGSEIWVARNWGSGPLRNERRSERIERLMLRSADLVVVVSSPIGDQVVAQGADRRRVLVNPNGVDPDRYAPTVDGSAIRARHEFGDRVVIGFIGTFGPWHGAEVLADAYGRLLARRPDLVDRTRLLMIGDGVRLEAARRIVEERGCSAQVVFAGRTSQSEGPAHLAACDVLASPHVPNADGTPFFGSPTKLFEYMAMGKAIVASDLDQIGEVLEDGLTGLLVRPADPDELASGIIRLVDDPSLRQRLGLAARARAVEAHTWQGHTSRILDALERVLAGGNA